MAAPSLKGGMIEYLAPGDNWTATVDEALGVAGGNVLELTGNRTVGLAGVASHPVGVAMHDAADDGTVTVISEGVVPLKASGAIAAGDLVVVGAAGAVLTDNTPDPALLVGIALEAIADTAVGRIKLRL